MATGKTSEQFLLAARKYQELADMGVRNGHLFYNLGTALLKAGDYDQALNALYRAERYTGARADITRNIRIAAALKAREKTLWTPWHRIPLFWHYGLGCDKRTGIALAAFTLAWIGLTLRALGRRRVSRPIIVSAVAATIVFGSSVAASLHRESVAGRAVPVVGSEAPGRE